MTRTGYRLFHGCNLAVVGTGLVYAFMKYMLDSVDEFAVVHHPWQPTVQHLHVLAAPALALMIGGFWMGHALPHLRAGIKKGKRSGLLQLWMALPMIFSGYLLQTSVSETWRTIWVVCHGTTSVLWMLGAFIHVGRKWPRRNQGT